VSSGSGGVAPIQLSVPAIQHPVGGNRPPTAQLLSIFSCLAFDSYFTIGDSSPDDLLFIGEPPADWPNPLSVVWATTSGAIAQQNPAAFDGSTGYFVRLMRISVKPGTTIEGQFEVGVRAFGTNSTEISVFNIPAFDTAIGAGN
jgi:hypothetical protein